MRVGFIGTGEIAAALVHGLAGQGNEIAISARGAGNSIATCHRIRRSSHRPEPEVIANSDVVFLCLMAEVARDVLPRLTFRADQQIISVMVDVPVSELHDLCAPASDIACTIPLSAVATGGSMLPCFPASTALEALFGATDTIIPVASQTALSAHFAGSALSAPLIALMQTGAGWLGAETGDAKAAEAYVAGVFAGFLRQMQATGADFETLLTGLATEGGLNASLKQHMSDAGAHDALISGLDALKPRLGL